MAVAAVLTALAVAAGAALVPSLAAADTRHADARPSLKQLAALVQADSQMPTNILQGPPLKTRPKRGQTIVYVKDEGVAQETFIDGGVAAAAKAIGWKDKTLNIDQTDPSQLVSAMKEALQLKPAAVVMVGSPLSQIASVLPAYKAAHVPILVQQTVGAIHAPILSEIVGNAYAKQVGTEMADWFVVNSHGHGNVLIAAANVLPITQVGANAFAARVHATCPKCHIDNEGVPLSDAIGGTGDAIITSALRRLPSDTYVMVAEGGFFTGLRSAMTSAGIPSSTKIMSIFGFTNNLQAIKQGQETVTALNVEAELGWIEVDTVLRHEEGMTVPAGDGGEPVQLVTKQSKFVASPTYNIPVNYEAQFKSLWHVG